MWGRRFKLRFSPTQMMIIQMIVVKSYKRLKLPHKPCLFFKSKKKHDLNIQKDHDLLMNLRKLKNICENLAFIKKSVF